MTTAQLNACSFFFNIQNIIFHLALSGIQVKMGHRDYCDGKILYFIGMEIRSKKKKIINKSPKNMKNKRLFILTLYYKFTEPKASKAIWIWNTEQSILNGWVCHLQQETWQNNFYYTHYKKNENKRIPLLNLSVGNNVSSWHCVSTKIVFTAFAFISCKFSFFFCTAFWCHFQWNRYTFAFCEQKKVYLEWWWK